MKNRQYSRVGRIIQKEISNAAEQFVSNMLPREVSNPITINQPEFIKNSSSSQL